MDRSSSLTGYDVRQRPQRRLDLRHRARVLQHEVVVRAQPFRGRAHGLREVALRLLVDLHWLSDGEVGVSVVSWASGCVGWGPRYP